MTKRTPERKAYARAYYQRPEVKARYLAAARERYPALAETPEYKARKRAYNQRPEVKARQRARYQLPEVKASKLEYQHARKALRTGAPEVKSGRPGDCEICMRHVQRIDLDHDHATDRFCGWLCRNCNTGLGKFLEDPSLLLEAIRYLARTGKTSKRSRV